MFKNILTGETTEFKGFTDFTPYAEDFTPYKEEAPYDVHASLEVCIDILKGVMRVRYKSFYKAVTEIKMKNGFRYQNPEQQGKWTYDFTYSFKMHSNQKDIAYHITIIFNNDGTISEVDIDNSNLQAFSKDVKDAIYKDFITRYNYCRAQEEPKSFNLKSLHKKFMAEEKFMNRDEFESKVRTAIYDTVRKYVIEDIFDLHKDIYVNYTDYLDEVNERFNCDDVSITWNLDGDSVVMDYYARFKVQFSGVNGSMYFYVRCGIEQSNTTDIFNYLGVALQDGERRNSREYHSQMLEKKIRNTVEAVVPHTYIEPKMAWPTVNPNLTQLSAYAYLEKIAKDHEAQLSAYDKVAKIAKDYEEEKKIDIDEAKRIYCKFDNEQREAIKTIWDDSEKNLLKELGDLKKELDIRKREFKNLIDDREKMKYLLNSVYGVATAQHNKFEIKEIIINEPAMIVFWKDGTKTIVKAQEGEPFDEEKGLAMAYAKKALGNNYAAGGCFKQKLKHAKRVNKEREETDISKMPICKEIMDEAMRRVKAEMEAEAAKEPTEKPTAKKPTTRKAKK